MNERIKALRKALNLTMDTFGAQIGISRSAVSMIESGARTPGDQTIMLICHSFNVSESWLRTGEGDMFLPAPASQVDALVHRFSFPEICAKMLYAFDALPQDDQQAVLAYARRLVSSIVSDDPSAVANAILSSGEKRARKSLADRLLSETSSSSRESPGSDETA